LSAKKITIAAVGAIALLAAGGAVSAATVGASSSSPAAGSASDGLAVCVTRATGAVRAAVSPCTKQEYKMVLGKTGDRGPRGVQGERGPRGVQGERGPRGARGERGDRGPSDLYWNEFTTDSQGGGLPIPGAPATVNVVSVAVPAGSYLFGFTATIQNHGGQLESIQCGTADSAINPMNVDVPAGVDRVRYVLNQPLTVPVDGVVTVACLNPFGGDGDLELYYGTVTMLRVGSSLLSVPAS
jgi:hypothetical protein